MHDFIEVPIKTINQGYTPTYATLGDAGADLIAAEDVILRTGERALISTGISVAVPVGCVGLIHPRSGMAYKHGVTVLNAPGTIDAGYRGEVKVLLINHGAKTHTVNVGDRIAQFVLQQVANASFVEVEDLDETDRGEGGFGSTGSRAATNTATHTAHTHIAGDLQ